MRRISHLTISFILFTSITFLILVLPLTQAHVPVASEDNDNLEHSLHIDDPLKSWAIYDEITETGEVRYYSFNLKAGDRLKVSIFTPDDTAFSPSLIVMTPTGEKLNASLTFFELPLDYNYTIIKGNRPNSADYEPFTPSANYHIVEYDEIVNISGKYYAAVYEQEHNGKFGIAIGYIESFSLTEWLLIPYDVINIHIWEGQHIGFILAPLIIIFVVGKILLFYRHFKQRKSPSSINAWLGSIAALLYIGSGGILLYQMIIASSKTAVSPAMGVTIIFMIIPIILGIGVLKNTLVESNQLLLKNRIYFIIYGILGLFLWAGLIIGPILLFVVSIMPDDLKHLKKKVDS